MPPLHKYRSTLRAMKSRSQRISNSDSTSHSSHTNFRYLEPDEMLARMRNLQQAKRTAKKTVSRLSEKLKGIIESDGIDLAEEDASDIEGSYMLLVVIC